MILFWLCCISDLIYFMNKVTAGTYIFALFIWINCWCCWSTSTKQNSCIINFFRSVKYIRYYAIFRPRKIMLYFTVNHKWIGITPKITLNFLKGTTTSVSMFYFIFSYLSFISKTLTIHRTVGEEGGYLFNSYIPIPTVSQKLRHQPGNYCRI